jgi:hypothetical protein
MSAGRTVVLSEARARQLLRRAAFAIVAVVAGLVVGVVAGPVVPEAWGTAAFGGGVVALLACGLWFFGVMGRLAAGLGRSPVYWVGGTFLAQKLLFIVAWVIAWALMRKAIDETYRRTVAA